MNNLKHRTFDDYMAIVGSYAFGLGLLLHAFSKHNYFSAVAGVLILLPTILLTCGVFSARLGLVAIYIFGGLYHTYSILSGVSSRSSRNIILLVGFFFLAYLVGKLKSSAVNTTDGLSDGELAYFREQFTEMDCVLGKGIDDSSFGVGKHGIATLVLPSQFALRFRTLLPLKVMPTSETEQALLKAINIINSNSKVAKFTYSPADGDKQRHGIEVSATFPTQTIGGTTIRNMFTLWLQDIAEALTEDSLGPYYEQNDS